MKKITAILLAMAILCCFLPGCQQKEAAAMNVLAIGSYGKELIAYLEPLAAKDGQQINAAFLDLAGSTMRDLSSAFAANTTSFNYYEANGTTYTSRAGVSADEILAQSWDVVILQQAVVFSGFQSTYHADLEFLTDYIQDRTDAKLYWNMSWAAEEGLRDEKLSSFYNYYDADSALMYNAIIDCVSARIADNDAFDGWIPTGAALWQVRQQLGNVTDDGHHLREGAAMLTASLTTLKTLLPDYDLSKADWADMPEDALQLVRSVVDSVCSSDAVPEKVEAAAIPANENEDVTVGQTTAPMRLHFPDLEVLEYGTVIVGAYESIYHKPTAGVGNFQEGTGRLFLWSSSDNGATWDYDNPLLVVDQEQIHNWGLAEITNRYEQLKNGNKNYVVMADPRDPNLSSVRADMDGDGESEEVLLFTFWIKFYTETQTTNKCYLSHSVDGGHTWSTPQRLTQATGVDVVKRGDIASFSDGQILIPYYRGNRAGGLLMEYDVGSMEWFLLHDSEVANFAPEEGENFNEVSFVAPDPDTDTVYAYCRENGIVLRSDDCGNSWELLANEEGLIHQPGFTVLDKDSVYVTWALTSVRPRPTYGKVFHVNKGWEATKAELIYASPVRQRHDAADPSCALLKDGRVLVVSYDTAFRSIVGNFVELSK